MRLIDADSLLEGYEDHDFIDTHIIYNAPTVDAVQVIRCKDCKHRPTFREEKDGFRRYDFPDDRCPGQCDDWWYNWMPNDDWFCANGERKEQ